MDDEMTRNDIDGDLQDLQPATPETVQVPVELVRELLQGKMMIQQDQALRDLLPAPKPRLVPMSYEEWFKSDLPLKEYLESQPDLFTTLDAVIDEFTKRVQADQANMRYLKYRIRAVFGVTS